MLHASTKGELKNESNQQSDNEVSFFVYHICTVNGLDLGNMLVFISLEVLNPEVPIIDTSSPLTLVVLSFQHLAKIMDSYTILLKVCI